MVEKFEATFNCIYYGDSQDSVYTIVVLIPSP